MPSVSVKPSGGDYTSLDTALATEAGDLSSIGPIDFEIWTFPGGLDEEVGIYHGDGWTNESAVNRIRITAATGESFVDAGPATPLYWDTAFAHVDKSSNYQNTIDIDVYYVTLSRLMIGHSGGFNGRVIKDLLNHTSIDQCIVYGTQGNLTLIDIGGSAGVMQRSVVILDNDGNGSAVYFSGGSISNVTAVRPSGLAPAGLGIRRQFGTPVAKNCVAFGFEQDFAGTWAAGTDYNASGDATAPGASSLTSLVFADQFENAANDVRATATGDLQAGTTIGMPATDIFGTAQTTPAWIGAHVPGGDGVEGEPADLAVPVEADQPGASIAVSGAADGHAIDCAVDPVSASLRVAGTPGELAVAGDVDVAMTGFSVSGSADDSPCVVAFDMAAGALLPFPGIPEDVSEAPTIDATSGTLGGTGAPEAIAVDPTIGEPSGAFRVPAGLPGDLAADAAIGAAEGAVGFDGLPTDLSPGTDADIVAGTVTVGGAPHDPQVACMFDDPSGGVRVEGLPAGLAIAVAIDGAGPAAPATTPPGRKAEAPQQARTAAAGQQSRGAQAA
ncbi:hypothetical protein [Oceanibacterium hippocampi]|uniref:Uncharacterized protein n=1 Tax=Oceanibacterium hippocampi TaxID=745714 RepID=A0A1Y5S3I4_9PROT|nr:hypothetical protein [Oceanibacterium hippocampi]SLN31804.1 hypothetical protein OCH7691_01156 [Oceanibacterium hippocampi]